MQFFFHVFFCLCMEFFRFIEFKQLCSLVQESIDNFIIWFWLQFCRFYELNWYYCDLIMIARNVLGRGVKSLKYSFDCPNNGRIVFFFHSSYRYVILIYHKMFWSWPWEQNRIVIIRAHLEINFSQMMDVFLLFFLYISHVKLWAKFVCNKNIDCPWSGRVWCVCVWRDR